MTPPRILIVDDELSMRDMLRIGLRREGYEIVVAENATQAIQRLQGEPFDLVLVERALPGR
jgi:DNA-binding response OmpR family regulator